jgi:hypothetical protein
LNDDLHPSAHAPALSAELFERMALTADGVPFDDADPSTWAAADATEPEIVRLGAVRFRIVDADAADLAVATGAIASGDVLLAMRVVFDTVEGAPEPVSGQYVVLATAEPDVSILFRVWITHADLHDPAAPDLGPNAVRSEALDALRAGEALIVQVLDADEQAGA